MSTTVPRRARRDLTAAERKRLTALRDRIEHAEQLIAERNRVISEIYDAGASVGRIAEQLNVSKEAVYLVIRKSGKQ